VSGFTETRRQPAVDQVHEGFEHFRVGPAHSITKGVQGVRVDFGQLHQQIKNALAQGQGLTFKQGECPAGAPLGCSCCLANIIVPAVFSGCFGKRQSNVVNIERP
jgi:hypothetical protein